MFGNSGNHGRAQAHGSAAGDRMYHMVRGLGSALSSSVSALARLTERGERSRHETEGASGFYMLDIVVINYAQLNYAQPEQIYALISTLPHLSLGEYRQYMQEWHEWCEADIEAFFGPRVIEWIPLGRGGWEQYIDLAALRNT